MEQVPRCHASQRGYQDRAQEAKKAVKGPYDTVKVLAPSGLRSWGKRWNLKFQLQ